MRDLTKGNPLTQIILFAIPVMIGNIFQELYSVVDTIVVGKILGSESLAAVGACGSLGWMVQGMSIGITVGCSIYTAQRVGARDEKGIRKSIATHVVIAIGLAVLLTAIFVPLTESLLRTMNTPEEIMDQAVTYLRIVYGGLGATILYNMLSATMRSLGDSKTPLYFLIFSSILNIVGDVVLILVFHMGVAGAALATVGAQLISGLACLVYIIYRIPAMHIHREDWKISLIDVYNHIRLGIPMGLQFSISALGMIIMQSVLNGFGAFAVAGFTVYNRVSSLLMNPMITVGMSITTFVGQNRGALRFDRVKKGVSQMLIVGVGVGALMGLAVIIFARPIIGCFISLDNQEVVDYAYRAIAWGCAFYGLMGFLFIYRGSLQGLGNASTALVGAILELFGRALVPILLAGILGYTAICITAPISWVLCAAPMGVLYYRKIKQYTQETIPDTKQ